VKNPYPSLAACLYKFGVLEDTRPPGVADSTTETNRWLAALLANDPAKRPIHFVPESTPDKPENGAIHTAAQKTFHYTVNTLLFNLESKLNRTPDQEPKPKTALNQYSAGEPSIALLTPQQEAGLYWLGNQLVQLSITRNHHPIFTYRDNNGEIKPQKHFNQLNSCLKRLKGIIVASQLDSPDPQLAEAINAFSFPPLHALAKAEEKEWIERSKTQEYKEIFLDLNPNRPLNGEPESAEATTSALDPIQPKEIEGFRADEIVRYHTIKRQQTSNPQVNNPEAWTLIDQSPGAPVLEQTKLYVWSQAQALLQKAEQTPGVGFQLPEARWSNTRHYALPHALRRMYEALVKQNTDLAELDPSAELLQILQKEQFSFGIATACERTGTDYHQFKTAWNRLLEQSPRIIQTSTRPEAILKVLKEINPQGSTANKLRFLEEFAVTGGYCIEISPRQEQYREQISAILVNSVSEIQDEQLKALSRQTAPGQSPNNETNKGPRNTGAALEPVLRTPISGVLRREIETNIRTVLKKELEQDPKLKDALLEIRKTSADLRGGTYNVENKASALTYIAAKLAESPQAIETSPRVLVPPGAQFHRNLEYLSDHIPDLKFLKEEELTGAALGYLNAKRQPEKDYCLRLAEYGNPELTRSILCEVQQAIVFLHRTEPLPIALAEGRKQLSLLTTPAHQLSYEEREANRDYFAGLARASTLWRNQSEQQQYRVPQKGYSTLQYARNLSQNRLNNEFFKNKLPFSLQMQTDLLILGLNILEKWKANPVEQNNPKRHLPALQKLSQKLQRTLEIDSTQAQEEAKDALNIPEIILEKTEHALFNFLRAEKARIGQELLQLSPRSHQSHEQKSRNTTGIPAHLSV
jgi:hypothetical protein